MSSTPRYMSHPLYRQILITASTPDGLRRLMSEGRATHEAFRKGCMGVGRYQRGTLQWVCWMAGRDFQREIDKGDPTASPPNTTHAALRGGRRTA